MIALAAGKWDRLDDCSPASLQFSFPAWPQYQPQEEEMQGGLAWPPRQLQVVSLMGNLVMLVEWSWSRSELFIGIFPCAGPLGF